VHQYFLQRFRTYGAESIKQEQITAILDTPLARFSIFKSTNMLVILPTVYLHTAKLAIFFSQAYFAGYKYSIYTLLTYFYSAIPQEIKA